MRRLVPLAVVPLALLAWPSFAHGAVTERVNVSPSGAQANGDTYFAPGLSVDGRYVVFSSVASNLGGSPGGSFVRDRVLGTTSGISPYQFTDVAADLRFVVFSAYADGLVPGDANGLADGFIHDRLTNAIERVSVATGGAQGNGDSFVEAVSADGNLVAFVSSASNLVPGDANVDTDIFVRDRAAGTTERVTVTWNGVPPQPGARSLRATMSPDGRYVAFLSRVNNFVPGGTSGLWHVFVRDRVANTIEVASILPDGSQPGSETCCNGIAISPDGRYVAFTNDLPLVPGPGTAYHVFVRDRVAGTTEQVSVASDGTPSNGFSSFPDVSDDGRWVVFQSTATNLVADDTNGGEQAGVDLFLRDRNLGTTARANLATDGSQASFASDSLAPRMSGDGRVIAFLGSATNLVPGDTNTFNDVFVRDVGCGDGAVTGVEQCDDGDNDDADGCDANCTPSGCGNGRLTGSEQCDSGADNGTNACCSAACALVDGDGDGLCDAFDRCSGPAAVNDALTMSGLLVSLQANGGKVALRGTANFGQPFSPPLDPITNGVRLLIADGADHPALDLAIPGGAGWTANRAGNVWVFKTQTVVAKIVNRSASAPGLVKFAVKGRNQPIDGGPAPYTATLFLHPTDDTLGRCTEARGACTVGGSGQRVRCR